MKGFPRLAKVKLRERAKVDAVLPPYNLVLLPKLLGALA